LVFSRSRGSTGYDVRRDLRTPLLETLEGVRNLLDANLRVMPIGPAGFHQLEIPDITWWIAREAVLNALVHRDYFLHQSIHMSLADDRIEITSPGGFIGGVTAENILRHPPVRRNPLLAHERRRRL
jgi:ATP-dependent DNA helicase RecG